MDQFTDYEQQLRERITQLRVERNISEHRMSLELGKSGSYIRSITSGLALPSVRELMNIIRYFDMTPEAFFQGFGAQESSRSQLCRRISSLDDNAIEKIQTFLDWIE